MKGRLKMEGEDAADVLTGLADEIAGRGAPIEISLARTAHGQRNSIGWGEEQTLHNEASARREICLPGIDYITAIAMHSGHDVVLPNSKSIVHSRKTDTAQALAYSSPGLGRRDFVRAKWETGFTVFMHESWQHLHHVVRYFDLIEKNEAPDTSLLEWLASCGVVSPKVIRAVVTEFAKPHGEDRIVLCEQDRTRLTVAAEVYEENLATAAK